MLQVESNADKLHDEYFIVGQYQYKYPSNREVQNTW